MGEGKAHILRNTTACIIYVTEAATVVPVTSASADRRERDGQTLAAQPSPGWPSPEASRSSWDQGAQGQSWHKEILKFMTDHWPHHILEAILVPGLGMALFCPLTFQEGKASYDFSP